MLTEFKIVPTLEATPGMLDAMFQLVTEGDQVHLEEAVLKKNIANSKYLAFAIAEDDYIAGCAAIKVPQKSYLRKVFERAGFTANDAKVYEYEIGYCVTDPNYRGMGVCQALIQELLDVMPNTKIFATTKTPAMRKIFHKFGFSARGKDYIPDENDPDISITLYTINN